MPKKIKRPDHTYAKTTSMEAMAASSNVTTLERIVETIKNRGMGAREYEVATNTSLKEPSPSKSVVRHQLEMHQRIKGKPTAKIWAKIVE